MYQYISYALLNCIIKQFRTFEIPLEYIHIYVFIENCAKHRIQYKLCMPTEFLGQGKRLRTQPLQNKLFIKVQLFIYKLIQCL